MRLLDEFALFLGEVELNLPSHFLVVGLLDFLDYAVALVDHKNTEVGLIFQEQVLVEQIRRLELQSGRVRTHHFLGLIRDLQVNRRFGNFDFIFLLLHQLKLLEKQIQLSYIHSHRLALKLLRQSHHAGLKWLGRKIHNILHNCHVFPLPLKQEPRVALIDWA